MKKKVIAVIASADTKKAEAEFLGQKISEFGCLPVFLDISTSRNHQSDWDISRENISRKAGIEWTETASMRKDELLSIMTRGIELIIHELYIKGTIHGAISLGGLQNTTAGSAGLRALPLGIPKMMISTVATGNRKFDLIMGTKDVLTLPSITDFTGLNTVSRTILTNAAAAITGMTLHAGKEITLENSKVIGTTLMGATNDGVVQAVEILAKQGYETISFHATGIGGKTMEEMIEKGLISAVMDLTLHEIVYEYFGYGFGYSTAKRLCAGVQKNIPMVICPAGIDFICLNKGESFPDLDKRKCIWHNSTLAHVRLTLKEVSEIANIIIERLNASQGNISVVIPLQGMRSFTRKGEALYDPDIDIAVQNIFTQKLKKDIPVTYVDSNFMDIEFSKTVANEMIKCL